MKPLFYNIVEGHIASHYINKLKNPLLESPLDRILNKLNREDRLFIQENYNNSEMTRDQYCRLFGLSRATYYRTKRRILSYIAVCLDIEIT